MSDGRVLFPPDASIVDAPYPLLSACEAGLDSTVLWLLDNGADVNLRSPEGWSPLIMAAKEGHTKILTRLLIMGAKPNPPDVSHTALRGASISGHLSIVKALLAANANPNHCSTGDKTALMGACMRGHEAIVQLLLEEGADPSITNEFGETARDLAQKHPACLAALDQLDVPSELPSYGSLRLPPPSNSPHLVRSFSSPNPRSPPLAVLTGNGFTCDTSRDHASSEGTPPPEMKRSPSLSPLLWPAQARRFTLIAKESVAKKAQIAKESVAKNKGIVRDAVIKNSEVVRAKLQQERRVSTAQLYLLTAGTWLLIVLVVCYAAVQVLKLLARVEVVWWLSRSAQLDDFHAFSQQVCADPWQKETVLCQAVEGNWLARQLVRAKLHEADVDHCDPDEVRGGCRHDPCLTKGLAKVLLGVADSWGSPLNNRLSGVYYALLPVRQRLRNLLRSMAKGKVPLSKLDRELKKLPLLERKLIFLDDRSPSKANTKEYILHEHVYPIIRTWGVIIGGAPTRKAKPGECPATFESLLGGVPATSDDDEARWPWERAVDEARRLADDVKEGFGQIKKASGSLATFVLAPFEHLDHQALDE